MIGQNIGKYRVVDRIGRGGMGTVYRAVDETLHRDVAIKVLNAELNDPGVARRFKAEAVTVARLNHPGIATIFELFQHEGQWLMVMEFLRGETLEALVTRKGPLDVADAAGLCMQALNALGHAHSLGVVHRDLKPANVMLTESGAIKIMDFGIARVAGTEHLTNAGFLMGTPAYMAPEQVAGGEVDARADLYAMGVVLFHLLTSALPFKGQTPFEMVQSRMQDQPLPIASVRDGLPPWVGTVLDIALARDPHRRFQSAPLFHEALRRGLANLPLHTPEPTSMPPELIATALPNSMPAVGPPTATPTPLGTARIDVPIAPTPPPTAIPMSLTGATAPTTLTAPSAPAAGTSPTPAASPTSAVVASSAAPAAADVPASATIPPQRRATDRVPPTKANIPMLAAGALVLLVLAGGGAWWWRAHHPPVPPTAPVAASTPAPVEAAPSPDAAPAAPAAPDSATPPPTLTPATTAPPAGTAAAVPSGGDTTSASGSSVSSGPGVPASGRGRGRGQPAPSDPLLVFRDVRYISVTGRRTDEAEAVVNFAAGHITAVAKKNGETLSDLEYRDLAAATYVHGKEPKWNSGLPSPPADTDFPSGIFRGARHWIVLQSRSTFLVLRLSDDDWRRFVETVTARTGVNVERGVAQ